MSVGGKKIPIHIRLTNIENPGDIQEFKSIHCAMKKCKKSFQTIKNYIKNKMIVNGFMWEAVTSLNECNSNNETIEINPINENIEINPINENIEIISINENIEIIPINEHIELNSINKKASMILSEEYVVYPCDSVKEVFDTNDLTNEISYNEIIEELSHIEHRIEHPIYDQNMHHKAKQRDQCKCILM